MFTGTLAMLHRALRLDARLLRTHLFRLAFAALVYLALLWAVISSRMIGAPGLQLFKTMTYLNLVLIVLAGVSYFATAITEEKEEETLPLLLLAWIRKPKATSAVAEVATFRLASRSWISKWSPVPAARVVTSNVTEVVLPAIVALNWLVVL